MKILIPTLALFLAHSVPVWAWEFEGYPCKTAECSGHRAGYDWAEENDITDPDDCSGNSQSFIEGCWAYAEENEEDEEVYF